MTVEDPPGTYQYTTSTFGGSVEVLSPGINNITVSSISPVNASTINNINPDLSVDIENTKGNNMDVYFYTNASGNWQLVNDVDNPFISFGNQTFSVSTENMSSFAETYFWNISVKDRITLLWRNDTYQFNTVENETPVINSSTALPANNSENISLQTDLSINIYDNESDLMSWNIDCSNGETDSGDSYNGTISLDLSELEENTSYTWWVNISDSYSSSNKSFTFKTNYIEITSVSPADGSTGVITSPTLNITPIANGDNVDIEFRSIVSGRWKTLKTYNNVGDNVFRKTTNTSHMDTNGITYTWSVNVTDNTTRSHWTNKTFTFTVGTSSSLWYSVTFGGSVDVLGVKPIIESVTPANESTDILLQPTLEINVSEPEGNTFDITWTTNASDWTQSNTSCTDGNYSQTATFANTSNTTYWFTVHINDTDGNWKNQTFHFTIAQYQWSSSAVWKIGKTSHEDIDLDMDVDNTDLQSLFNYYLQTSGLGENDINEDGIVDYLDRSLIQNRLGETYG